MLRGSVMSAADLPLNPLVIYVDDEEPNRIVFELSLGTEFSVVACETPEQAFKLLEERDVAVHRHRHADADDERRASCCASSRSGIPRTIRMVITAYSDVEPILRAINEGLVARYIIKPWVRDRARPGAALGDRERGRSAATPRRCSAGCSRPSGSRHARHDLAACWSTISSNR